MEVNTTLINLILSFRIWMIHVFIYIVIYGISIIIKQDNNPVSKKLLLKKDAYFFWLLWFIFITLSIIIPFIFTNKLGIIWILFIIPFSYLISYSITNKKFKDILILNNTSINNNKTMWLLEKSNLFMLLFCILFILYLVYTWIYEAAMGV